MKTKKKKKRMRRMRKKRRRKKGDYGRRADHAVALCCDS